MSKPVLRHIAARWSMVHYPTAAAEWSLDQKLAAVKAAGFDGIIHPPHPGLSELVRKHDLILLGYVSSGNADEFSQLLKENLDCGARCVNVQLADEDTPGSEALRLATLVLNQAKRLGLSTSIEVHRDTCTETPEKAYALANAYEQATSERMPITWDFSHFAVVKHLAPNNFIQRLIVRPDLIQFADQFHFRPFNGHHCQIPVTDGSGNLTPELVDWLPFAEAVLKCWLEGNANTGREIFACPEMGPLAGGYNLSSLPNSWEDAVVLRGEIDKIWKKLTATDSAFPASGGEQKHIQHYTSK